MKPWVALVTTGNVDHGKSTLLGKASFACSTSRRVHPSPGWVYVSKQPRDPGDLEREVERILTEAFPARWLRRKARETGAVGRDPNKSRDRLLDHVRA